MTTSNKVQTQQVDPKVIDEVLKRMNDADISGVFMDAGLIETSNIVFELKITSKETLDSTATSSVSTASSGNICFQVCYPCPTNPAVACLVRVDCDNLLH